jgi:hypothetical protein
MQEQQIHPHKVTKPIQLLAAWLVGLILTNAIFLSAAIKLNGMEWERGALVVAAIANVPIFLLALFILQTKFRAELQEDTFYSEYLSKKTAAVIRIDKNTSQDALIESMEKKIAELDRRATASVDHQPKNCIALDWSNWAVALNDLHPKFVDIRNALRTAKITLAEMFGSNGMAHPPKKWIIAMSHALPFEHRVLLLNVLIPFGFDGFQFWEPQREAGEDEDVYIGSYGSDTYAQITDELSELINGEVEAVDLKQYLHRHEQKFQ